VTAAIERPEVVEAAKALDGAWFEQNPGATERCRPAVPGELGGQLAPGELVYVEQVVPGLRLRSPAGLALAADALAAARVPRGIGAPRPGHRLKRGRRPLQGGPR
jgi:hypothetical protein